MVWYSIDTHEGKVKPMGTKMTVYTTDAINNTKTICAAAYAIDLGTTVETKPALRPNIYEPEFIEILNRTSFDVDETTSDADMPESNEDFDIMVMSITSLGACDTKIADASVYRPKNSAEPFMVNLGRSKRFVYARANFRGNGCYNAAAKFAAIVGPGRTIVFDETEGESYEGAEYLKMIPTT